VDWMLVLSVFGFVVGIGCLGAALVTFIAMLVRDELILVVPVGILLVLGGTLVAVGAGAQ
jgi:hypothetical protein